MGHQDDRLTLIPEGAQYGVGEERLPDMGINWYAVCVSRARVVSDTCIRTSRKGVVKDDDVGVVVQGTSDIDALLLPTTQIDSLLADLHKS